MNRENRQKKSSIRKPLARFLVIAALCLPLNYAAAQESPLDVIYGLIDSSAAQIDKEIPQGTALMPNVILPEQLQTLHNYSYAKLKGLRESSADNGIGINYTIEEAKTDYIKLSRESLFGSYIVEREISLKGNYVISGADSLRAFNFVYKDEIDPDKAKELENSSLPFTRDEMPEAPFFSNLTEPVVAIAAAAVTAILFFTARSK